MGMLKSQPFVASWGQLKWLLWISLYVTLGVFVPSFMTRAWAHRRRRSVSPHPKRLFQHGELGLASLWLAISVIWNLQASQLLPHTVALGSILLAFSGIMASAVWIESYCRQATGEGNDCTRAWRDSRNMTFLVLSMAAVTEILLDRYAKVAVQ